MGSSCVRVTICKGHVVELSTDAPDINNLISTIVNQRDGLDPDQISVDCDSENFDKSAFTEVIADATRKFLNDIRENKDGLEKVISEIDEKEARQLEIEAADSE